MNNNIVRLLVAALVVLLGWKLYQARVDMDRLRHMTTKADTVWVDRLTSKDETRMVKERTDSRTLGEKLGGTKVIQPHEGDGPVIIYEHEVPQDTGIARLNVAKNKLDIRLAVPTDSGMMRYHDLPTKYIGKCTGYTVAANGMVRCNEPVLGVLDLFIAPYSSMDITGVPEVGLRAGMAWKRFPGSPTSIVVWVDPTRIDQEPRLYLEVSRKFTVLGR
jgi:hypothetical protein